MAKIEIKSQHLAKRCEICHQSDSFDPKTNICYRCQSAFFLPNKPKENIDDIKDALKALTSHIANVRTDLEKHQKNHIDSVFTFDKLVVNFGNKVINFVDNLEVKFFQYKLKIDRLIIAFFLLPILVIVFISLIELKFDLFIGLLLIPILLLILFCSKMLEKS